MVVVYNGKLRCNSWIILISFVQSHAVTKIGGVASSTTGYERFYKNTQGTKKGFAA
jgi:hypothetical protein